MDPNIKGSHDLDYKKVHSIPVSRHIVMWHWCIHSLARGHVIRVCPLHYVCGI